MTTYLDEIERLLGEATPGDWSEGGISLGSTKGKTTTVYGARTEPNHQSGPRIAIDLTLEDAALIVALKNNAPKLLAIAKAAKAYAEHHKRYDDPMWTPEDGDAAESRRIHEQLISAVDGVHWEHV